MTRRRSPRARAARIAFDALSIEGGLLSPEWLSKLAQLDAGMQSETDYRVPRGLGLRDEIGRFWRIAQALWREFLQGRERSADPAALSKRFVTGLLREVLGFASLAPSEPLVREGRVFPVGHLSLGTRVPVVIAPAGFGLDAPSVDFGEGGRKRSAFGLLQEFLNSTDEALWGVVTDGLTLRLVRDNASLTRPAWIEADLARIFSEDRYADFAALWLLLHESRFGAVDKPSSDCALETWRGAGREEGTRARDKLRAGVERALNALGQGFVAHPENAALREALSSGALSPAGLYQELLRLAYRLIFMLTAEERGVLHPPDAGDGARALYAGGYSLRRLRERALRRTARDRHGDLWDALGIVFRGVARGEPRLALPALGGLFGLDQCPHLDAARLSNGPLLEGIFRLSWIHDDAGLSRVNWRDMGPEELGSVYESLLELVPQVDLATRRFVFATGDEARGNARKTSGSYYTPDSLVQVLLDSALEPVVEATLAANPSDPIEALLSLSVVDPACGSGHFLLAAARRLAAHVARLSASGSPSAAEYRHALRQVVSRCIYGVDLNPMALELCRVSLWMEAVEPGLALTFLDAHIQHGNALLGATPELMEKGIPDAAWEPIEGDDKKVASALKKKNKSERTGQGTFDTLWSSGGGGDAGALLREVEAMESLADDHLDAVRAKSARWDEIRASEAWRRQRFLADAWCAAFVWPKQPGASEHAPTHGVWRALRDGKGHASAETEATVTELAAQYRFLHWHLAFPQVFKRGGFDVVLGNPPWERVKLQEQEFFASKSDAIAGASNAAARKKLIAALPTTDPVLWTAWCEASREAEGQSHQVRASGRYPLCGKGDVNTYALFAEHNRSVLGPRGRAGFIVPTGIATDDTTKEFFQDLMAKGSLVSLFDFENRSGFFRDVDSRFKFSLMTLQARSNDATSNHASDFVFYASATTDIWDGSKRFSLSREEIALINPETLTCPVFRSSRDARLVSQAHSLICQNEPTKEGDHWGIEILQKMIDATIHANIISFTEAPPSHDWIGVYEGRMAYLYNHRYSTYEGVSDTDRETAAPVPVSDLELRDPSRLAKAAYWVSRQTFSERLAGRGNHQQWFISVRYVSNSTNERTVIAMVRPNVPSNNKLMSVFLSRPPPSQSMYVANLSSHALDYMSRQKVGGTSLTGYILRQLPVLPPSSYEHAATWNRDTLLREWMLPRVLELTYTAWDLEAFGRDVGWDGPPFRWDPARRELLRAELDAAFFHLYGIARDDVDYIMETFPIVRRNDEKAHGEFRTKRLILEIYDELAIAARTGRAYVSRLDPPPADPRVAHPPREGGKIIPLRSPARPQPSVTPAPPSRQIPSWSPDILPAVATKIGLVASDGLWGTPLTGVDLGIDALAAVLRNMGGPASRDEVERAVVLTILPSLMLPKFDAQAAPRWRRAIGKANISLNSISALSIPWAEVLRRAAVEHLLTTDADGRWLAGAGIGSSSARALDARAMVSLSWLESTSAVAEDSELRTQLGALSVA